MYCHDLEVMSLNPDQVELGVRCTSVLLEPKISAYNDINDSNYDQFNGVSLKGMTYKCLLSSNCEDPSGFCDRDEPSMDNQ